jgi:hypothetical protein
MPLVGFDATTGQNAASHFLELPSGASPIRSPIIALVAKEWPEEEEYWPPKADAVSQHRVIFVISG